MSGSLMNPNLTAQKKRQAIAFSRPMLGTDNIAWYTDGTPSAKSMAAKTMLRPTVALRNVGQQVVSRKMRG
jgi:hypothetical protein